MSLLVASCSSGGPSGGDAEVASDPESEVADSTSTSSLAVNEGTLDRAGPVQVEPPSTAGGIAYSFDEYFASFGFDYEPAADREALAEGSTVVVDAILVDLVDGRIFGQSADDPFASRNAFFVFESDHLADRIYVELPRPSDVDLERLWEAMPQGNRSVIYVRPIPPLPAAEEALWFNARKDGDQWWFTTPQGWILDLPGRGEIIMPVGLTASLADAPAEGSKLEDWLPDIGVLVPDDLAS